MKKITFLAAALLAVASSVASAAGTAVSGCTGGQAVAVTGAIPFGASGEPRPNGTFVKTGFAVSCSAKVNLQYSEVGANSFAVVSGSTKGNQTYKGNSAAGGTIIPHGSCPAATGCTDTEVAEAMTAAETMGSST